MPRSKEIPEDVKEKIIFYYKSGKGYKAVSKIMGLHRSTVRTIISKWKTHGTVMNRPRSGRPTKISPRTQRKIIQEVAKKPGITSKELQASLALAKVKVHDSTIRRKLGQIRKHKIVSKQKSLQKKKINACVLFENNLQDDSQVYEENPIKTEVAEVEVFI
uniref:Transposase Tc1-like domain-containing protein n=1 Tax=Cyprinus carpio carpio TaxID=630221 RepID=A0A9J7WZE8_CYPCA